MLFIRYYRPYSFSAFRYLLWPTVDQLFHYLISVKRCITCLMILLFSWNQLSRTLSVFAHFYVDFHELFKFNTPCQVYRKNLGFFSAYSKSYRVLKLNWNACIFGSLYMACYESWANAFVNTTCWIASGFQLLTWCCLVFVGCCVLQRWLHYSPLRWKGILWCRRVLRKKQRCFIQRFSGTDAAKWIVSSEIW